MSEESAIELADFLAVGEFKTSVCLTGDDEQYGVDVRIDGVLYYTILTWSQPED